MMETHNDFINKELLAGGLLMSFAVLALIVSNSPLSYLYVGFLQTQFSVLINSAGISKPIVLWINDGLMAVFFLLVALELKREVVTGELNSYDKAVLPLSGALGGMIVPVMLYKLISADQLDIAHAWAIPMATDIAFALGVLALFGKRVPVSLKIFLMTLAVVDDIGAIIVIAIFHTAKLSWGALLVAAVCLITLFVLNRLKVKRMSAYLGVGFIMWLFVLKSGVHATLAGVLLGLLIPMFDRDGKPMLELLEHDIHPMVVYCILPLFAFSNAGVPIVGMSLEQFAHPLILSIVCGLIVGKVVGIFSFTLLAKRLFKITSSFTDLQLLGVSLLCGIGFTMSFFIGGLSFADNEQLLNLSRIGILASSLIAMLSGVLVLSMALPKLLDTKT